MTPKKKKVDDVLVPDEVEPEPVVEQVVEQVPEPVVEPAPPVMVTVLAREDFKDGAFKEKFFVLGYPVLWKAGEKRTIPVNLFKRCRLSGAKLDVVVSA